MGAVIRLLRETFRLFFEGAMVVPWSVSTTEPITKSVQYMGGGDAGDIIFDYGTMLASPGVIGYALHIIGICVAVGLWLAQSFKSGLAYKQDVETII